MLTLKIKNIETKLNKKLKKNHITLGIDTASRTGWAIAKTFDDNLIIDYGILDIKSKDKYFKYNQIIDFFDRLIWNDLNKDSTIIIEDTFYHFNPKMFAFISRIGMIVYTIAELLGIKNKIFITASQARKKLGFKGTLKKEQLHNEFRKRFDIKLIDKDVIDAIILALVGAIK